MVVGILLIIVIGVVVAMALAWNFHLNEKAKAKEKIDRLEGAQIFKMRILGNLMKMKNKTNYKARLMEELDMEIAMLKICVGQLKREKLITEGPHVLTLTDFGKKYAKVYVEQELNDVEQNIFSSILRKEATEGKP